MDGEELGREGQLGELEKSAGQQCELALVAAALERGATGGEVAELVRAVAGAAEAARPARVEEGQG